MDRPDEARIVAVLAELPADPCDVRIDHTAAGVIAVAPDPIHQLISAQDHTGLAGEREQDLELERGERDLLPVDLHPSPSGIEVEAM